MTQAIRWSYVFVDRPREQFDLSSEFWTQITATHLSERRGDQGEFATLLPQTGDACVKVQGVEAGGGAHLDLAVEDVDTFVRTAEALGATVAYPQPGWAVMRSPGGQLFCVVPWEGEAVRSGAVEGPEGAYSRLDQICIDLAPALYDTEAAFWAALTGWERVTGSRPEFQRVAPTPDLPVRILLQRLAEDRPTSAHLDLACTDVDAVRTWHEKHGATLVRRFAHWTVMRDPAGALYCLTSRDPHTGNPTG
ncbi:VOC family protein [Streptomyces beijiangensis]|uniref:VOC family protein n=1 Tax=Streptomyces beijiangensis TaxID=163361 RepID=A0A939F3G6_9ACTN|nr:VOC family protein [Streptomyces beijiangensis]MBO0511417.1 VOC family protein [Streptomyces beijiangensis]